MAKPFDDVRVIDFTQVLSGPYATMQLALMGADVIKVENRAGGDQARGLLPCPEPFLEPGLSAMFLAVNAGKRSLTLDLKSPAASEVVKRLVRGADVVVQNFKAQTMARMGYGYEALKAENPKLVYCSISGYGQTGPRAAAAAYDPVVQAASGMMAVTGTPETGPLKTGYWCTDSAAALAAAYAISAALFKRERCGEGDHIDLSMQDVGVGLMAPLLSAYQHSGFEATRTGNRSHTGMPTSDAFPTGDGFVMISAPTQGQFEGLMRALGRPDLVGDPRFAAAQDRIANACALRAVIKEALATADAATWEKRITAEGVPAAQVSTIARVCDADEQLVHRGTFKRIPAAAPLDGEEVAYVDSPFKLETEHGATNRPPPMLGAHTDEVLAEIGYSPAEIAELREDKVI